MDENITADRALTEIPGIYQAVGKLQDRLRRCKPGSKLHQETWDKLVKLENEGDMRMSRVRMALKKPDLWKGAE